jgi:hypothetical protein
MSYPGHSRTTSLLRGGDPAPGDVGAVRHVVTQLHATVDRLMTTNSLLRSVGSDRALWTGSAANAFARKRDELVGRLNSARQAYESAADGLETWTRRLERAQTEAAAIVAQARQLARASGYPSTGGTVVAKPPALIVLQREHDAIASRTRRDAEVCAHTLDAVLQQAHADHNLGEQLGEFLAAVGHTVQEGGAWLGKEIDKLAPILMVTRDVLEFVSAAASIAALATLVVFPPAAPFLGTLALATASAVLVIDATLALGGKQSWSKAATDGVFLAAGGGGAVARTIFKGAKAASQLEMAASGAHRVAAAMGGEARTAAFVWLNGHGALQSVAGRAWVNSLSRTGVASRAAARFTEGAARARADRGVGAAVKAFVDESVNPVAAAHEAKVAERLLGRSERYGTLPALQRWLPSNLPEATSGGLSVGLQSAELSNDASTVDHGLEELSTWVRQQIGPRPAPQPGPAAPPGTL